MLYSNLPDMSRRPDDPYREQPSYPASPAGWYQATQSRADIPMQPNAAVHYWKRPEFTARRPQFSPYAGTQPRSAAGPKPGSSVPRAKHRKAPLAAVFFVLVAGFVLYRGFSTVPADVSHEVSKLTANHAAADAAAKAAAAQETRMNTYKATVNQIIAAHPGQNIAVSTIDVADNSQVSLGDSGTFTGASTAKLITAIALLHQVELGTVSLDETIDGVPVQTLLSNMIINSDNDAWLALNTYITHPTLKAYMARLGWTDYDPDVNTFLPADMAQLMAKLYEGKLINDTHKQLLLGLMQQANKQEYIVSDVKAAGPQYTVYHKAGWLDGLMHDVAIVTDGKRTIVLTIYTFTNGAEGDSPSSQETFKQITDAALTAYFPPDPGSN